MNNILQWDENGKKGKNARNIHDFDLKNAETISQIRALFDIIRTLSENLIDGNLAVGLSNIADSGNRMILSAMEKELETMRKGANK